MREEEKHLMHYFILFAGFALFSVIFILFKYNPMYQVYAGVALTLYYITWGAVHHKLEGRLNRLVLLEYVFVGTLVFLLLLFALKLK